MRDASDIMTDILSGEHTELEGIEVPVQRLPGFIRWTLRGIISPFMMFDLIIQRLLRFCIRSPYRFKGRCKQCGVCCRYILCEWPRYLKRFPLLEKLYVWWLTEVNGFYFYDFDIEEDGCVYRLMTCRYLSSKGKCLHHRMRPAICRQYPWIGYFRRPWFLPKCGYK